MNKSKQAKISVVFIGSGNLATHLAKAMYTTGYSIEQIYSRTIDSAKVLAEAVDAKYTNQIDSISKSATIYITALTDEALVDLVSELTEGREQGLWVHTAGSVPISLWKEHCSHYGVLYPMQTFSKKKEVVFKEIPVFIEASTPSDLELLNGIAKTLTEKVYEASSEQRKSLHLAAVFACNFTNHMYALASDLLKDNDLPFEVLLPLIDETAQKVHQLKPNEAQTGPAIRNDKEVMDDHLDLLYKYPNLKHIYKEISKSIINSKAKNK